MTNCHFRKNHFCVAIFSLLRTFHGDLPGGCGRCIAFCL